MYMQSKKICINIELYNDGMTKKATFIGFSYIDAGFLVGSVVGNNKKLSYSEYTLLSAFTLTGCPIAARTTTPELNPWRYTNGAYKSSRLLETSFFKVDSKLESIPDGNNITMNLYLDVQGNIPMLKSIKEPFQESIKQSKQGLFEGSFECKFINEFNEETIAHATSKYQLAVKQDYVNVWRNITILGNLNEGKYQQIEQIDMFNSIKIANKDLDSKKLVSTTNA